MTARGDIEDKEPEDIIELAKFLVENCDPSDEVQELARQLEEMLEGVGREQRPRNAKNDCSPVGG